MRRLLFRLRLTPSFIRTIERTPRSLLPPPDSRLHRHPDLPLSVQDLVLPLRPVPPPPPQTQLSRPDRRVMLTSSAPLRQAICSDRFRLESPRLSDISTDICAQYIIRQVVVPLINLGRPGRAPDDDDESRGLLRPLQYNLPTSLPRSSQSQSQSASASEPESESESESEPESNQPTLLSISISHFCYPTRLRRSFRLHPCIWNAVVGVFGSDSMASKPTTHLARQDNPVGDASLQGILDRCPSLVHFGIKLYDFREYWKTPLKHRNIHSLDVFGWPEYDSFNVDLTRFPELLTLRFLDESLRLLPGVPRDLPRDNEMQWGFGDGDGSQWSAWISTVTSTDPDLDDPGDEDYEFDDDTEGSGTSDVSDKESDSDSDAGSCMTVSEDEGYASVAGEFYLEENREFNRDEAWPFSGRRKRRRLA
ncbi:hypothetical protein DFH09DRAFT_1342572 [Mycena vulgaris]|nr:hypothetical protein DFH09DRAFT_1342572 [Mycena vulgaris]